MKTISYTIHMKNTIIGQCLKIFIRYVLYEHLMMCYILFFITKYFCLAVAAFISIFGSFLFPFLLCNKLHLVPILSRHPLLDILCIIVFFFTKKLSFNFYIDLNCYVLHLYTVNMIMNPSNRFYT